eukprot:Nitzschia sp. Nitz4//scaffold113_size70149//21396//23273//NITZ4_005946-RA/size70149-processed-gene-0.56-mRNA-1//1//CDS//3329533329//4977//frame0
MVAFLPALLTAFGCNQGLPVLLEQSASLDWKLNGTFCDLTTNGIVSSSNVIESEPLTLEAETLEAPALVLELWMTPSDVTTRVRESLPVFTIKDPTNSRAGDCSGLDLRVSQRGPSLDVRYYDHGCRILVIPDVLRSWERQHVVVSLADGITSVYVDGVSVVDNAPNRLPKPWASLVGDSTAQLFSVDDEEFPSFDGSVHSLALYTEPLPEQEIATLYEQGLDQLGAAWEQRTLLEITPDMLPALLTQGKSSSFWVGGNANTKLTGWTMYLEIHNLPLYGNLRMSEEGRYIQSGQRIPLDDASELELWYRPQAEEFFNIPTNNYLGVNLERPNEYFTYQLLAVANHGAGDSMVIGQSEIVSHPLSLVHVNHALSLDAPLQVHVPKDQSSEIGKRPVAFLTNIAVDDSLDYNVDRVRVDLWALNGTLTISDDLLHLIDFASCRGGERYEILGSRTNPSWSCHGTGTGNRNMTFVAAPGHLSKILSSVQYDAFYWNQEDTITLRIFDGENGQCLSVKEHEKAYTDVGYYVSTSSPECFDFVRNITVPPVEMPDSEFSSVTGYLRALFDIGNFGLADAIFWICFFFILSYCCMVGRRCIRCIGARGSKVQVENYGVTVIGIDEVMDQV